MDRHRIKLLLFFGLGLFFLQPTLSFSQAEIAQDEELLGLVRDSLEATFQALDREHLFPYRRSSLNIEYDRKGELSRQEEEVWQAIPLTLDQGTRLVEILIERDGVAISPEKIRKQLEKIQKTDRSSAAEGGEIDSDFEITIESFFPRYRYQVIEQAEAGEKVIEFTPKKNLPAKNQTDRILNHLTGKFWIDPASRYLRGAEVSLTSPITRYLGTVQLGVFTMTLSFSDLAQDTLAIDHLDLSVRGRVLYLFRFWEDVQEIYTYYSPGKAPAIPALEENSPDNYNDYSTP